MNDTADVPEPRLLPALKSAGRQLRQLLTILVTLAVLCGLVFPLLVVGISQVAFPERADGSLIRDAEGHVVGSKLVGQAFADARYFHPRPSAAGDGYDASMSSGANFGPTNPDLIATIEERAAAYRALNRLPADAELPADAVTTSASGLDPHISPANARLQVQRVARARSMLEAEVQAIVERHVENALLGFFGEPRVNVLELNLALDRTSR